MEALPIAHIDARRDAGWSSEAIVVLERAVEYHGGWARWRALRTVSFVVERLWGFLPWMKGLGRTFPLPRRISVFPHQQRTVFDAYPREGSRGVFDRGSVRIESARDGMALEASIDHRRTFRGFSKDRRWCPLDALYFFGYALWHYHTLPFSLREGRFMRLRRTGPKSDGGCALDIELPPSLPTHCSRQTFHFDAAGCLRRHDYTADIVGFWARGAHHWMDYRVAAGMCFAARRRVVPRAFGATLPMTALGGLLDDFSVELDEP